MNRSRHVALPAAILSLILLLAACGTGATSPSEEASEAASEAPSMAAESEAAEESAAAEESEEAEAGEERVRIDNSAYDPAELTIAVGTEVTWVNADTFAHTITEGTDGQAVDGAVIDEEIAQNGTVSFRFDEPGTYEITCRFHPNMQMTITVEG